MNKHFTLLFLSLAVCLTAGAQELRQIETRKNATVKEWTTYPTRTVDKLKGFKTRKADPATDQYGGWKTATYEATGFFRTQKIGDRWWMIDPEGHPYIFKGVAVFSVGHSDRQKGALKEQYGSMENWAQSEMDHMRSLGFNGLGA